MGAEPLRDHVREPSPGTLVAGKYRLEQAVGRGGMGRVVAAVNETTGKRVALKWLLDTENERAVRRFVREAQAAGRIHHPNVVDVYDVVEHEGAPCIVMELLRGESLATFLGRHRRLRIRRALSLAIEIARGTAAAHAAGVIHRDLKPGNVFLSDVESGARVKILDFGISKLVETKPSELTDTGVVLGTPQYLAPEQVRSATEVDARTDVYALGAILYEMLTGQPPHASSHLPALLVAIATEAPRPPALVRGDIPSSLSELVLRALAKDPDARFPTMNVLLEALRAEREKVHDEREGDDGPASEGELDADTLDPAPKSSPTAETIAARAPERRAGIAVATTPSGGRPFPARWSLGIGALVLLALGAAAFVAFGGGEPSPTIDARAVDALPTPLAAPVEAPVRVETPAVGEVIEVPVAETEAMAPPTAASRRVRRDTTPPAVTPVVEAPAAEAVPEATPPIPSTTPSAATPRAGTIGMEDL